MAPIPGTVRSGGGCGLEELELELADEELRREAAQATTGDGDDDDDDETGDPKKKDAVDVDDVVIRREHKDDDDDDLRSALAAAPRELPCIFEPVQRATSIARGGLCEVEAGEPVREGGNDDDEILIAVEKEVAIDRSTRRDGEKGESSRELLLLLLNKKK